MAGTRDRLAAAVDDRIGNRLYRIDLATGASTITIRNKYEKV